MYNRPRLFLVKKEGQSNVAFKGASCVVCMLLITGVPCVICTYNIIPHRSLVRKEMGRATSLSKVRLVLCVHNCDSPPRFESLALIYHF